MMHVLKRFLGLRLIVIWVSVTASAAAEVTEAEVAALQAAIEALQALATTQAEQIEALQGEVQALRSTQEEAGEDAAAEAVVARPETPGSVAPRPATRELRAREVPAAPAPGPLSLSFYGYIKLDAAYNSDPVDHPVVTTIAVREGPSSVRFSARQTRLGVNLALPQDAVPLKGKVETDFYGAGSTLRLRRAFVEMDLGSGWQVLAGQEWDTGSLNVVPKTINFRTLGGAGWPFGRRAQVRLSKQLEATDGWRVTVEGAVADPVSPFADYPLLQGNLKLDFPFLAGDACVGLRGMYGSADTESEHFETSLIQLTAVLPIAEGWTLQGSAYTGKALAGVISYGMAINTSLGTEVEKTGGFVQLIAKPFERWSFSAAAGFENHEDDALEPGSPSDNRLALVNAFFQVNEPLVIGVEWMRIQTEYLDGAFPVEDADLTRFQGTAIFSF